MLRRTFCSRSFRVATFVKPLTMFTTTSRISALNIVGQVQVHSVPVRFCATSNEHKGVEGTHDATNMGLSKEIVTQRIIDVVKNFEKVDATKVTESSHFQKDLGLDSLDVVEVVMALEQEFVLDIPDHDAEKIQSIPEAVAYISSNPSAK